MFDDSTISPFLLIAQHNDYIVEIHTKNVKYDEWNNQNRLTET